MDDVQKKDNILQVHLPDLSNSADKYLDCETIQQTPQSKDPPMPHELPPVRTSTEDVRVTKPAYSFLIVTRGIVLDGSSEV